MKIVGILLIIFGLVDCVGSYAGFDLWYEIGIALPEIIWQFSAYIEMGLGYFLFKLGSNAAEAAAAERSADE